MEINVSAPGGPFGGPETVGDSWHITSLAEVPNKIEAARLFIERQLAIIPAVAVRMKFLGEGQQAEQNGVDH